jgi:hypothetical protein
MKLKCLSLLVPPPHFAFYGSRVDWTGCLGLWFILPHTNDIKKLTLLRIENRGGRQFVGFSRHGIRGSQSSSIIMAGSRRARLKTSNVRRERRKTKRRKENTGRWDKSYLHHLTKIRAQRARWTQLTLSISLVTYLLGIQEGLIPSTCDERRCEGGKCNIDQCCSLWMRKGKH